MTQGHKYGEDVLSGKVVSGELFRLAVERHFNDLDRAKRGDIPYIYHQETADHAINFMEKLRHVKGVLAKKKQNFILSPYQKLCTEIVFGWLGRHEDTGDWVRRFTKVYHSTARKSGKTSYLAAVGCYGLFGEGEEGAEIYSAATKLPQAKIVFDIAGSMITKFMVDNPIMKRHLVRLKSNISYIPTESFFEPLPADSKKLDGLNPHMALPDEVHEHPDDGLIKVLETGMGSRVAPLLYMITTAGFNIYGPCYKIRSDVVKILKGITTDERTVGFISTLDNPNDDNGDDWKDKSVWGKSNPHLGTTPYMSYMNDQFNKAVNGDPDDEDQFKTKNMNVWTSSGSTWIRDDEWMKSSSGPVNLDMLKGRMCYLGLDLSSNKDLTVLAAVFPPTESDPNYRAIFQFYCPEESIPARSKSDKVRYDVWAADNYIKAIPGKVIKYRYVFDTLNEWKRIYNVKRLDYDIAFSYQIIDEIESLGIKTFPYGQNTKDMNAPIKEIERLVTLKEFDHGRHPIMRWNVSNVMLYKDSNGKKKFDKRKIVDRIDGCVALAMAMGGYLSNPKPRRSKYESEPLFPGM